jgi:hypothetical protein
MDGKTITPQALAAKYADAAAAWKRAANSMLAEGRQGEADVCTAGSVENEARAMHVRFDAQPDTALVELPVEVAAPACYTEDNPEAPWRDCDPDKQGVDNVACYSCTRFVDYDCDEMEPPVPCRPCTLRHCCPFGWEVFSADHPINFHVQTDCPREGDR